MRSSGMRDSLVLFSLLSLCSCGSVGEPLPPLLHIPGKVEDVRLRQESRDVVATWTWPALTSEGRPNNGIVWFRLYALSVGPSAPPLEIFAERSEIAAEIGRGALAEKRPGATLTLRFDVSERLGERAVFAVVSRNERGKTSDLSPLQALDLVRPAPPPSALAAEAVPAGVELQWAAVAGAEAYRVERRAQSGEFAVLGQASGVAFLDQAPLWGEAASYRVRSLAAAAQGLVPGEPSPPVQLTAVDRFPPEPPERLLAIPGPGAVELTWASSAAPDWVGYRLYRNGDLLTDDMLTTPQYNDAAVASGKRYAYTVSAVDRNGNESARSEPVEVQAP